MLNGAYLKIKINKIGLINKKVNYNYCQINELDEYLKTSTKVFNIVIGLA